MFKTEIFKGRGFRMRSLAGAVVVAGLVGFLAGSAFTDEADSSDAEMMKMMLEMAKPGPQHEALAVMAGDWDVQAKMWMSGPEPSVSKATSKNSMLLGGRYMQYDYSGVFSDMPFEGRGTLGFCNVNKKYQSVWVDNFSTSLAMETGSLSEDGKTLTMSGHFDIPGGQVPVRHVYTFEGKDKYVLTGYSTMGDKEMKSMELTFTRKAAAPAQPAANGRCCPEGTKGPGY